MHSELASPLSLERYQRESIRKASSDPKGSQGVFRKEVLEECSAGPAGSGRPPWPGLRG